MPSKFTEVGQPTLNLNSTVSKKYDTMAEANRNGRKPFLPIPSDLFAGLAAGGITFGHLRKKRKKREQQFDLPVYTANITGAPKTGKNKKSVFSGNYYQDIQDLAKNLDVLFTPIGILYIFKNKRKDITLDKIELSEMDEEMQKRWNNKDKQYFKNLMLTKMYTDIRLAEQVFMKSFVDSLDTFDKKAEEEEFLPQVGFICDDAIFKVAEQCANEDIDEEILQEEFEENLASTDYGVLSHNFSEYDIDEELLSLEKISAVSLFGDKEQKQFLNHQFVKKNVKTSFFPDRVAFSVKDKIIGTLPLLDMNEQGYEAFYNKNRKYFKNFFLDEIKKEAYFLGETFLEKTAAEEPEELENIFESPDIHPVIYNDILTESFGEKWYEMSSIVLFKLIEDSFLPKNTPIDDTVVSKLLSVKTILTSADEVDNTVLQNMYAFEKVTLGLCGLPVNFLEDQENMLDISNVVYSLSIINELMNKNIFGEMGMQVVDYISDLCAINRLYSFLVDDFSKKKDAEIFEFFTKKVNELIVEKLRNVLCQNMNATDREVITVTNFVKNVNKLLFKYVPEVRSQKISLNDVDNELKSKYNLNKSSSNVISLQIKISLSLDSMVAQQKEILTGQRELIRQED